MYFAETELSSFGQCKVLSWKNSLYSDFDRKEINYRGQVIASVAVPATRKIEALLLVRANSLYALQSKLDGIAVWLFDAGTDKLYRNADRTSYFNARCTQITKPEYNGLSARITVTFTCSDHRLYCAETDQPYENIYENNMSNFTFAGQHCLNDMGCLFVKDSEPVVPAVNAHVYQISGMSGTLRYNTGRPVLKETQMSGTLYFVQEVQSDEKPLCEESITRRRHAVAEWLIQAERAELVFDSDLDRVYQAEVISETSLTRSNWENGMVKVKFVLQPYSESRFTTAKSEEVSVTNGNTTEFDLDALTPQGISYETPLDISIKCTSGTVTDLVLGYKGIGANTKLHLAHSDFSFTAGDTLDISGRDGTISLNGTRMMKFLKDGDFPVLSPPYGGNFLSVSANATAEFTIDVSCNVRWV